MEEPTAGASEEQVPFLTAEPPPAVARGLAILLIALFVATALMAAVVKIPETVSAKFVLVPVRGTDPIRAPQAGRVTEAGVAESARVPKGKVLFVLQSPGAADRDSDFQTAEARERSAREGLENARRKNESETLAAEEELERLNEKLAFLDRMLALKKEQLQLTKEQAERSAQLATQGLTSNDEQADARIRLAQAGVELEQLRADRNDTKVAIEKLGYTEKVRRAAFRDEERGLLDKLNEARIRGDALRGETGGSAPGAVTIQAPCDGTVLHLAVKSVGAVVREGDTLADISCAGERLQAQLDLPQEALSQIRPGQNVKLLYDSFPYQRYGVTLLSKIDR